MGQEIQAIQPLSPSTFFSGTLRRNLDKAAQSISEARKHDEMEGDVNSDFARCPNSPSKIRRTNNPQEEQEVVEEVSDKELGAVRGGIETPVWIPPSQPPMSYEAVVL